MKKDRCWTVSNIVSNTFQYETNRGESSKTEKMKENWMADF